MLSFLNRLTLTRQWALASLLPILPLVAAVIYAAQHLALQAKTQRDLAEEIKRLEDFDAQINRQLSSIERSARQYILLRRTQFWEQFQLNVELFQSDIQKTNQYLSNSQIMPSLSQVIETLVMDLRTELPEVESRVLVDQHMSQANRMVRQVRSELDDLVQSKLEERDQHFDKVKFQLILIGLFAAAGTFLLVILSSVAVTRPVHRLAYAIRQLGHGHWQEPIQINGPADLRSLGGNLEWMRNRLAATERQKQAFLRHITHELKTPLAAIVEAGSLLRDEVPGPMNAKQLQVVNILTSNADHLQVLIQQLLNYNAVAHGLLHADAEVDLEQLCNKIRTKLMDSRPSSECQWHIEGNPKIVRSDPQALEMILSNLLSNAHDFTPESGRVDVTWGQEKDGWWLSVKDNGPGMAAEEQAEIFKPFYQGRARRKGPLKGTGLGLAIVQECVAHLTGSIEVVSGVEGSQFIMRFPHRGENKK